MVAILVLKKEIGRCGFLIGYFVSPAELVDEDSSVSVICKCFTIRPMIGEAEFARVTVKSHAMIAATATTALILRAAAAMIPIHGRRYSPIG